jgi:Mrp family chromosome partitioning ATPase
MRNPSICRYLGCTPPRELTEYFLGQAEAGDVLFSPGLDKLTLSGSNVPVANASELLSSDRLEGMIDFIRQASPNPLILLDLPPAVNTDDALVVAPRLDAMVLVVSEGVTRRDELETALRLLADFPLAGVVLNKSLESIGSDYYGAQ